MEGEEVPSLLRAKYHSGGTAAAAAAAAAESAIAESVTFAGSEEDEGSAPGDLDGTAWEFCPQPDAQANVDVDAAVMAVAAGLAMEKEVPVAEELRKSETACWSRLFAGSERGEVETLMVARCRNERESIS